MSPTWPRSCPFCGWGITTPQALWWHLARSHDGATEIARALAALAFEEARR